MSTSLDPEARALLEKRQRAFQRCLNDHIKFCESTRDCEHCWFAPPRRAVCPCCGYPALDGAGKGNSPIRSRSCFVCGWQNDKDRHVPGNPHPAYFDYSLAEAQGNFLSHGQRYRKSDTLRFEDLERSKSIRAHIIGLYEALLPHVDFAMYIDMLPEIGSLFKRRYESRRLSEQALIVLQARRRAFEKCLEDQHVREAARAFCHSPILAVCPCCGYPTLTMRRGFDICSLCGWQDDGQDDAPPQYYTADIVAGGPNFDYSLTEARSNFQEYQEQFRPSDELRFQRYKHSKELRKQIVEVFEAMLPTPAPLQYIAALPRITELRRRCRQIDHGRLIPE